MKLHRFYLDRDLVHDFWTDDKELFHQWTRVMRFQEGREVVLFNAERETRLYQIEKIGNDAIHLKLVTEMEPSLPEKDIYLCFSLLKKDKIDWVLQKGTELGVSHFVPLMCDRTEKTGWNHERAQKIVTEAAEQCGRSDIPRLREPITPQTLINELGDEVDIFIAERGEKHLELIANCKKLAIMTGPEGGWSDEEKAYFVEKRIPHVSLSSFTLRAETAAIAAAALAQRDS